MAFLSKFNILFVVNSVKEHYHSEDIYYAHDCMTIPMLVLLKYMVKIHIYCSAFHQRTTECQMPKIYRVSFLYSLVWWRKIGMLPYQRSQSNLSSCTIEHIYTLQGAYIIFKLIIIWLLGVFPALQHAQCFCSTMTKVSLNKIDNGVINFYVM